MDVRVNGDREMAAEAGRFLSTLPKSADGATVVTLSGELGAGKTTYTQAIARALGVEDTVASPTFVIQKTYALAGRLWESLIHIDAYRLKSADELRALGWEKLLQNKENLVFIEWPERVPEAIPENAHEIYIDVTDGEERIIRYGT